MDHTLVEGAVVDADMVYEMGNEGSNKSQRDGQQEVVMQ